MSRQSEWPKAPKATASWHDITGRPDTEVVARQSEWPDQPPRPTESPPAMGEEVEAGFSG